MIETQQKTNQYKNVAVAIVRDEDGKVLLVKRPPEDKDWEFPSNVIVPGATYTETFVSVVLETTGCIVEAVSLVSSEKQDTLAHHYEYVECKVVCRESKFKNGKGGTNGLYKWVPPSRVKSYMKRRMNRDIRQFLGI